MRPSIGLRLQTLGLAWVLLGAACLQVKAAMPLSGTFGFTPIGTVTYSGSTLGQAASVTLPVLDIVNTVPPTYQGAANDFYSGAGSIPLLSHVIIDPSTLNLPSIFGSFVSVNYLNFLTISDGTSPANRYDFSLLGLMKTSNGASDLEVYGQGILHDTQGVFADTAGILSIAFTQTGQSGAVNASFSVATSAVPEPGTFAVGVFAAALVILGIPVCARRVTTAR